VKKALEDKGTKVAFLNMTILERVLHMKGGVGETSYANNSLLQVLLSSFSFQLSCFYPKNK
jgi:hypothetical protein